MRKGFTLIEIMFSLVIAGLLAAGLMATITQLGDVRRTVSDIVSSYGRASIFQQQMERDLMGAFVPTQYDLLPTQTGKKEGQPQKRLEDIFTGVSKGDGGQFEYLTFITSNPLEIYFGIKNIKLKPRVARVVYRLLPDQKRKNSFVLTRQEGTTKLAFDAYSKDAQGEFRAFTMIDGIQNLKIKFISVEEKKEKENNTASYTYKKVPNWKAISEKEQEVKKTPASPFAAKLSMMQPQAPRPRLPQHVELELSLWDSTFEKSRTYTMTIPIMSRYGEYDQPQEGKEEEAKNTQSAPNKEEQSK